MRHDRTTRERQASAAIEAALREARFHEGRAEWVEAIAAAQRAFDLAIAAEADAATTGRSRHAVTRYEDERLRANEDAAMTAKLEELRSRWSNGDNHEQTDEDFAAAFRAYGYDLAEGDPAEIGARLGERRIAADLAAAIDDWCLLQRSARKLHDRDWKRLVEIARAADPDEFRNRVRSAAAAKDVSALTAILRALPDDLSARSLVLLGHGTTVAGDPRLGVVALRRAMLADPRDPWVHARMAYAFEQLREPAASLRHASAAVALRPESAQLSLMLGDALVMNQQSRGAIPVYRRAVKLDPTILRSYIGLGLALFDQKDYRGTIRACEDAIRHAPTDALPYYVMASGYNALKEDAAAVKAIRKAAELGPDLEMVWREMGTIYMRMRRWADALVAWNRLVKLDGREYSAWLYKGSCHQQLGQLEDALVAYRAAQRLRPDDATANLWIARVHWLRHEWKDALPWLERAHELGTKTGAWTYPTGRFIEQARAWQHIQPRLEKILSGEDRPADATEKRFVAELLYETKQYEESVRFWKALFLDHPETSDRNARYVAACCAVLSGRPDARRLALGWLQRSLEELRRGPPEQLRRRMSHWSRDGDFASVREQLATLPADEQPGWRALWADVAKALQ
jgi:tetratricopeptide (TPR) repeat protein